MGNFGEKGRDKQAAEDYSGNTKAGAQFQPAKGHKIKTNHLFNLCVAVALVILLALTVGEVAATTGVISQMGPSDSSECDSLPSRYSIRTQFVNETSTRLRYTEEGLAGIDSSLINLLSIYRTCSR